MSERSGSSLPIIAVAVLIAAVAAYFFLSGSGDDMVDAATDAAADGVEAVEGAVEDGAEAVEGAVEDGAEAVEDATDGN